MRCLDSRRLTGGTGLDVFRFEIDALAYANSAINEVSVVEVKSHLREEAITQLNSLMANFKMLFPEHKDKKLYGIIAAVNISEALKKRVSRQPKVF